MNFVLSSNVSMCVVSFVTCQKYVGGDINEYMTDKICQYYVLDRKIVLLCFTYCDVALNRTKRMVVDILRAQPGESLTNVLYTPATSSQVRSRVISSFTYHLLHIVGGRPSSTVVF